MKTPLKIYTILVALFCLLLSCEQKNEVAPIGNPKLVVGIVVDQMRYDYLTRFESHFGDDGFKRLTGKGFNFKNNHFNYIPTYTGPGHASIFTGTTPKYHGIIGNNWYDKILKETVYCAGDDSVSSVGTTHNAGKMSPHRMLTTTFSDENRLFTQMKGKSIGISLKDRGAILPAGHTANGAYWFHGKDEGVWISSSFYMSELPEWVETFNASDKAEQYFKTWDTFKELSTYSESGSDENNFEGGFNDKDTATFPYDLNALKAENGNYDILKATPYGNSLTADFAMAAIKGELLGKDATTDVLTVSFSSTDYVGHNFGVNSKEIEDTYIRLDADLERFFQFLDTEVGAGEYVVFLTADHGAINVPAYLDKSRIPSGYLNNQKTRTRFGEYIKSKFNSESLVENVSNNQVFLNRAEVASRNLDITEIRRDIANELIAYDRVDKVYTAEAMINSNFTTGIESLLQNGYHQKRSGDIILVPETAFISYGKTGSTHGSGLNYDTHVPLLFYGKGIKKGVSYERTVIPDIAPTISAMLGISFPNASTGRPLTEILD